MTTRLMALAMATAVAGVMSTPTAARAGDWSSTHTATIEQSAADLVGEIERVSHDIRYHLERLDGFTRHVGVSTATHVHHLHQAKALVNDSLRPAVVRLGELQSQLPAWKQASVDRMIEAARMLAADLNSAILAKASSDGRLPVLNAEYRTHITNTLDHADALVSTADAAYDYATARIKATRTGLPVAG